MREYLFHGKREDNGEWVEGSLTVWNDGSASIDPASTPSSPLYAVIPESVGQYTGFDEWILDDESRNAKLYENARGYAKCKSIHGRSYEYFRHS